MLFFGQLQVHGSPCHVVYTDYRPTPLQHYVFPAGEVWGLLAASGSGALGWGMNHGLQPCGYADCLFMPHLTFPTP